MQYVIYPDMLFFENFLCNVSLLVFFKYLLFPAATGKKIILASLAVSLCNTLGSILFFRAIWILQLGVLFPATGILICSFFEIRDARRILFVLYQMILWTLVLGGIFQALQQWMALNCTRMLLATAFFTLMIGILEKALKIYKRQNDCMREIVLYWNNRSNHMRGFADTGNHLFDPISKKPVSVISKDAWKALLEDSKPPMYHLISYTSVGNPQGLMWGAQIDYMVIMEENNSRIIEKPMIAITEQPFTGIFQYSILLHNDYC